MRRRPSMTPDPSPGPARVVLVEDDPRTLQSLQAAVAASPALTLAAAFDRAQPALAWLQAHEPDVLLTDLGLPDGSGRDLIAACAARHPRCDIMVVSMFGDERNVLTAIEAGASGYILKDGRPEDIALAIQDLRAGGSPMSPLIARRLLARVRGGTAATADAAAAMPLLTPRESETLDLIARGYTYQETARLMGVSMSTVQTHVKSMYGKLAVRSRAEAVFEARALGLLGQPASRD